jgi:hypothetical protein
MLIDVTSDDTIGNWSLAETIEETKRLMSALNQTAQQATKSIKADMPSRFTMRKNWAQKSIRSGESG